MPDTTVEITNMSCFASFNAGKWEATILVKGVVHDRGKTFHTPWEISVGPHRSGKLHFSGSRLWGPDVDTKKLALEIKNVVRVVILKSPYVPQAFQQQLSEKV